MARARSEVTVHVEDRFPEWLAAADKVIVEVIDETLAKAAAVARVKETAYETGDLRRGIYVIPAGPSKRGWTGAIGDSDWKATWFEKGTAAHSNVKGMRGKRAVRSFTKTGRARRKAPGLTSGVKGLHYLRNGVYSNRQALLDGLRLRLDRIKV